MTAKLEFVDREIASENMVIARDLRRKRGLEIFLNYGTLLGTIREKDFIPHDDDVDFGLYGHDKSRFIECIPELEHSGFQVKYIRDDGYGMTTDTSNDAGNFRMYKLERKGQEMDFFLAFKKRYWFFLRWYIDGRVSLPVRFLDNLSVVNFLGQDFSAPADPIGFLRNLYGKTWNVPIKNTASRIGWLTRIKELNNPFKVFFYPKRYLAERTRKARISRQFKQGQ